MLPESRPERESQESLHIPPEWVASDSTFFVTINCELRHHPQLTLPDIPEKLFSAVSHYRHSHRWWPEIFLLMPDHLHALISFSWDRKQGMDSVISGWKRYTARALGIEWQRGYFDHRIRNEADHQAAWCYIRENPVRAGLADSYDTWPHVWLPDRVGWKRPLPPSAAESSGSGSVEEGL